MARTGPWPPTRTGGGGHGHLGGALGASDRARGDTRIRGTGGTTAAIKGYSGGQDVELVLAMGRASPVRTRRAQGRYGQVRTSQGARPGRARGRGVDAGPRAAKTGARPRGAGVTGRGGRELRDPALRPLDGSRPQTGEEDHRDSGQLPAGVTLVTRSARFPVIVATRQRALYGGLVMNSSRGPKGADRPAGPRRGKAAGGRAARGRLPPGGLGSRARALGVRNRVVYLCRGPPG